MRLQVRTITADRMEESLSGLSKFVAEPQRVDWSLSRFHANHAASRVEILALLAHGPRDLNGPVSWRALLSDGQRVAREILASATWADLDKDAVGLARTAANRALLDARHTGLRSEFRRWNFERDRAAFESHLIDRTAYDALMQSDDVGFLRHRASLVRNAVSSFLTSTAGLGQPHVRPIETYLDDAELKEPL
jgi:hypothetical protein